jgi:hypothetical protein
VFADVIPFSPINAPSAPSPSSQGGKPSAEGPLPSSGKRTHDIMWVIIGIVGGSAILLLIIALSVWRCITKKRKENVKNPEAAARRGFYRPANLLSLC